MSIDIKIIEKVGKKSLTFYNRAKVYRVITVEELCSMTARLDDCHIVVIERINESEQEQLKEFIIEFSKKADNKVLFYIEDKDDMYTSGVADELEYKIITSLEELHSEIERITGVVVRNTLWDEKKDDLYDLEEEFETFDADEISSDEDIEAEDKNTEIEVEEQDKNSEEHGTENEENNNEEKNCGNKDEDKIVSYENTREDSEEHYNVEETENEYTELYRINSENIVKIEELTKELRDTQNKLKESLDDMKKATARISELDEEIKYTKEENNDLIDRYNAIANTDSIEENCIPFEEYEKIISDSNSKDTEIENLTKEIEEHAEEIERLKNEIKEHKSNLEEIKSKLDKVKIENVGLSTKANKLPKLEAEVFENKSKIKELSDTIDSLNNEIETERSKHKMAEQNVYELTKRVEELDLLNDSLVEEKVSAISKLNDKESIISGLESENNRLNKVVTDNNKSYSDSIESIKEELNKKIEKLNAKLVEAENKLKKEEAKNKVITDTLENIKSGSDSTFDSSEIDKLESTIESLKNQVSEYEKQINELKENEENNVKEIDNEEISRLNQYIKKLEGRNNELENDNKNLKEMNDDLLEDKANVLDGIQNSIHNSMLVSKFNYNGKGKIVAITGYGSTGVTTTAMSITYKLLRNKKVIYVDLNLTNPELDQWVKKSPSLDSAGNHLPALLRTSLGVFFEDGFKALMKCNGAIRTKELTQYSKFDYINGVYGKLKEDTIAKAEYEELFAYLGSKYDYIIVDCGDIGDSDVKDSMIKSICYVASTSLYVIGGSSAAKSCSAMNRANSVGLKETLESNGYVILNNCISSGISEIVKSSLNGIDYMIMPYENELSCRLKTFNDLKVMSDRFSEIITKLS